MHGNENLWDIEAAIDNCSESGDDRIGLSDISDTDSEDKDRATSTTTRPEMLHVLANPGLGSQFFFAHPPPLTRLTAVDDDVKFAGLLVHKIGLSRADVELVNEYVRWNLKRAGVTSMPNLPSKKVIERHINKACDRTADGSVREAVFEVPPDVPGCVDRTIKFKVLCIIYT